MNEAGGASFAWPGGRVWFGGDFGEGACGADAAAGRKQEGAGAGGSALSWRLAVDLIKEVPGVERGLMPPALLLDRVWPLQLLQPQLAGFAAAHGWCARRQLAASQAQQSACCTGAHWVLSTVDQADASNVRGTLSQHPPLTRSIRQHLTPD